MRMKKNPAQWPTIALLIAASVSSVGCTGFMPSKDSKVSSYLPTMPWSKKKDEQPEPYPNPVRLAATWTPDTLIQTGRTPTRGFGGRLYFFDERSRIVPVEGTLSVHGFDDKETDPKARVKPFEFTPEQFTQHFSNGDLGASYSVWIPWDAVGGEQKNISLVATFKTKEGKIVQGIPASVVLPGRSDPTASVASRTERFSPQFVEHRDAAVTPQTDKSGLVTTTIGRRGSGTSTPTGPRTFDMQRVANAPGSMVAAANRQGKTPYIDVMNTNPSRLPAPTDMPSGLANPGVMPASAQMPLGVKPASTHATGKPRYEVQRTISGPTRRVIR